MSAAQWLSCVLVALAACDGGADAAQPPAASARRRAVPVTAEPARRGDLPIYRDGLGTVTAYNTATVRTRVDGPIVKVTFEEGQRVKKGELLAVIDERPLEAELQQARAQLARDQATLASARADLSRFEAAREAVSKQQIEHARAAVGENAGVVGVDRASITATELQLSFCRIKAPISGVIGLRLVDVGNVVHAADAQGIAVITQVQPIAITFTLPQGDLPAVQAAHRAGEVEAKILDRDLIRELATGKLLAIDNQIDVTTGTARFKAEVDNDDGALFPNQFVNVRLLVGHERGVVLAPTAAIQPGPQGKLVYVVADDNTIVVRPVTVGAAERDTTIVESGLDAGELVVTAGVDKLGQGTEVEVTPGGAEVRGATGDRPAGT
jgi:membrane fusion protein, multidrug efflux system